MTYKVFESGETLTANDVQTYFMDQVVIQVPTEAELATLIADHPDVRVAYAEDTDKVYVYQNSAWEPLAYEGGDFTLNDLTVTGNLTVTGTTTTVDSTTIQVKDSFVFEGLTPDAYETTLQVTEPTADRTITLPDATGTVALTSDLPSLAGYLTSSSTDTLTNKSIDATNNTVTNISLTTGVTGTLPIANGGTGQTSANAGLNALLPSQTSNSGKYLTTDGTDSSWASVSGGGMTLLATMNLSGASGITSSTFSNSYSKLVIFIKDAYCGVNQQLNMRPNNDTNSVYSWVFVNNAVVAADSSGSNFLRVGNIGTNSNPLYTAYQVIELMRLSDTGKHFITTTAQYLDGGAMQNFHCTGVYNGASPITSIRFYLGSSTFTQGTAYIYGVN